MKRSAKGTGGGECSDTYLTATDEVALSLLGSRATGLKSRWCDDDENDNDGMHIIKLNEFITVLNCYLLQVLQLYDEQ